MEKNIVIILLVIMILQAAISLCHEIFIVRQYQRVFDDENEILRRQLKRAKADSAIFWKVLQKDLENFELKLDVLTGRFMLVPKPKPEKKEG